MSKVYTKEETGCWIDGTFGLDHAMRKLAEMARSMLSPEEKSGMAIDQMIKRHKQSWPLENPLAGATEDEINAIAILATGDPTKLSDDHHEFDLATDYLTQHTADDLSWLWEGGDLILTDNNDPIY